MSGEKIKSKKWIIVLSVVILVAIAVTLIIVFLPKNVSNAVERTNTQTQSMFLKQDKNKKLYKDFQTKITNIEAINKVYGQETQNVYTLTLAINQIMDFYNDYIVFAEDKSTFQSNYGVIMKNYDVANTEQKKMEDVIVKVMQELGDQDNTFFESYWKEFRGYYVKYLNCYVTVINSLCEIYKDCVPNGILANQLTNLVLDNVDNYLNLINKDFEKSTYKIQYLNNFISYLDIKNNNVLIKYNFSEELQESYSLISTFETIYGKDKTLSSVIDSINENGFTFESVSADSKGVLDKTKTFLQGGLKVWKKY